MPKKAGKLCCQVNPIDSCWSCGKVVCSLHASLQTEHWTCNSHKCIATFERNQRQQKIDMDRKREQERAAWRKEQYGDKAKPTPDTSSNGYRLLKRIESASPHKKPNRH